MIINKGTKYIKITLRINSLDVVRWLIDASYNTHENCRGHTGVTMSLGQGVVLILSLHQKLNLKSSTEWELVGAHDGLSLVFWSKKFIEAQGYTVQHNKFHQNNDSTILLENNGRASISKWNNT